MRCNYKKTLQNKQVDIFEEYRNTVFRKAKENYYDKDKNALTLNFYDDLIAFVTDINRTRERNGIEEFITLELKDDYTAEWYDETFPDKVLRLETPMEFLTLYSYIVSFAFEATLANGELIV